MKNKREIWIGPPPNYFILGLPQWCKLLNLAELGRFRKLENKLWWHSGVPHSCFPTPPPAGFFFAFLCSSSSSSLTSSFFSATGVVAHKQNHKRASLRPLLLLSFTIAAYTTKGRWGVGPPHTSSSSNEGVPSCSPSFPGPWQTTKVPEFGAPSIYS